MHEVSQEALDRIAELERLLQARDERIGRLEKRNRVLDARSIKTGNELAAANLKAHTWEMACALAGDRRDDKARFAYLRQLTAEQLQALPIDWQLPEDGRCPECLGTGRQS